MSVAIENNLELAIGNKFHGMIASGFGAVVVSSGGSIITYGNVRGINERVEDGFALDCLCVGAKHVFGLAYVVFRLEGAKELSIRRYKGDPIFAGLNAQKKTSI